MFITEDKIKKLRQRNEQRMQEVKQKMGNKWVLHPDNAPAKNPEVRILR